MSAANLKKLKVLEKFGGRGMKLLKKQREKQMNNKQYVKYIFWISLSAIVLVSLSGS
jgi:hypothetical protein